MAGEFRISARECFDRIESARQLLGTHLDGVTKVINKAADKRHIMKKRQHPHQQTYDDGSPNHAAKTSEYALQKAHFVGFVTIQITALINVSHHVA